MNIKIAQQLLNGSRNIDRMRIEVHQIVKMVVGLACKFDGTHRHIKLNETFVSGSHKWEVIGETYSWDPKPDKIIVKCLQKVAMGGYELVYSSRDGEICEIYFHTETVQSVYENLHVFVNGMLSVVPELADKLKPLINASSVFA